MRHWKQARLGRLATSLALTILVVLTTFGLGSGLGAAQEVRTVKIGTFKLAHMMAPWFYEQFAPKGIKFEVYTFPDALEIEKSVAAGTIDFGMYGGVPTLLGIGHGDPLVIVASAANGGAALVVKKEAPWKSIKDMRGRRIGYGAGSYQHLLLVASLRENGMTVKDVDLIKVPWAEMALALQRGDIDAFMGSEPVPTIAMIQGYGRVLLYPYETPLMDLNSAYSTRRELVEKSPELVQAVISTHRKAVEYMNANVDKWASKGVQLFGIDEKIMRESLKNLKSVWDIDDQWLTALKAQGQTMVDLGFLKQEPDWDKVIDLRFVKRARAEK